MNQISWLIYLSNVSGNIGGLLVLLGIVVGVVAAVYFVTSVCMFNDVYQWDDNETKTKALKNCKAMRQFTPLLIVVCFLFWIAAAFCPSQETVLAIAASQAGEQLLKSPTANLAEQALNAWLKRQITPVPTTPSQ